MSPFTQYIRDVQGSVKKRGLWQTARVLWSEVTFDLRHGTDTMRLATLDSLGDISSSNKTWGGHYQGVNAWLFRKTMALALRGWSPRGFVDFGSGKGRALLLASQLGFEKVVGVEFSPTLCNEARENWKKWKSSVPREIVCEIRCEDATQTSLGPDLDVFFFFNPFGSPVLDQVVDRVKASLEAHPRTHRVVYMNPLYPEVFKAAGFKEIATLGSERVTPDARIFTL